MESDRFGIWMLAVIFGTLPIVISIVLYTVSWRAANGRLARNPRAGFRTPTTMRSERTWIAAHRAALKLTPLYVLTAVLTCVALWAAALHATTPTIMFAVGLGASAVLIALVIYTAFIAGKAAKAVDDHSGNR